MKPTLKFRLPSENAEHYPQHVGRPSKIFEDLSDQSKRKRVANLTENYTYEELVYAARIKLHAAGLRNTSNILKEVAESSRNKIAEIKKVIHSPSSECISRYSPDEALSLYVDAHLSKHSYTLIQREAKKKKANIYPPYNVLISAKNSVIL